jgi:1-acyl-sn-glycerol-3-phosphate acyltransferase
MLILANLFAFSLFGGFFIVPMYTLMQERSELKQRSRIIAANNILNALFMVIASVLLVVLRLMGVSLPVIILILSLLNIVVAAYIYTLLPEFLLRFVAWIVANCIYRIKVYDEENVPLEGGAVLISNHVSFVDWLLIAAAVHRPQRFVMDHSYFTGFIKKRFMKRVKVIPIAGAKESPELKEKAFANVAAELRDGAMVCIFPEGTITRHGELNPFKPGILRILKETSVPVIPMAINGMWGSFFSRKGKEFLHKRPRRFWSRIEVRIGKPIPPQEATLENLTAAVAKLRVHP